MQSTRWHSRRRRQRRKAAAVLSTVMLSVAAILAAPATAGPHCPPRYSATWVAGPSCGITGFAYLYGWGGNENGVMVGSYACPGGQDKAFVSYDGSTLTPLTFPQQAEWSAAYAVNDSNLIGGELSLPGGHRVFVLDGEKYTDVGALPGHNWVEFGGMNAKGVVVGTSISSLKGTSSAFRWEQGVMQDIGADLPLQGDNRALGVSNNSLVTGFMGWTTSPPNAHAYVWNDGKVIDLGLPFPDCFATEGFAINNKGYACGRWWRTTQTPPFFRWRGFVYDGNQMIDLGLLGNLADLVPQDINNSDQVVGYAGSSGIFGFLWHNNALYNLNDLIIPGSVPIIVRAAYEITDESRIFGFGSVPGAGSQEAISLTPLPPRTGDVDCDIDVDVDDLLGVINQWGPCDERASCSADLDLDGLVGLEDLMTVIVDWDK